MQRFLLFWLGLAALLLAGCRAETPVDRDAAAPAPALWVIEKGGHKAWLFGTVHMLPKGVAWETPAIKKAIKRADILVLEAAGLENEKRTAAVFEQLGKSPGLPAIAERVPAARRPALAALMTKYSLNDDALTAYESWAAALLLSSGLQRDLKLIAGEGVERRLSKDFLAEGKSIIGLETVEGQLGIFDRLPEDAQRDFLTQVVEEADSAAEQYRLIVKAWLKGDIERISDKFMAEFGKSPALAKPLLIDRNSSWAQQIETLMKQPGKPMIAVGTGHLVGPDSLQAMLAKRGFRISRVE